MALAVVKSPALEETSRPAVVLAAAAILCDDEKFRRRPIISSRRAEVRLVLRNSTWTKSPL